MLWPAKMATATGSSHDFLKQSVHPSLDDLGLDRYIDQAGLELTEVPLLLLPKLRLRGTPPHPPF